MEQKYESGRKKGGKIPRRRRRRTLVRKGRGELASLEGKEARGSGSEAVSPRKWPPPCFGLRMPRLDMCSYFHGRLLRLAKLYNMLFLDLEPTIFFCAPECAVSAGD